MNILVMGGSGLFGRKTVASLLRDPEVKTVVSLDMAPPPDWFMKTVAKYAAKFHYVRGNPFFRLAQPVSVMRHTALSLLLMQDGLSSLHRP